MPFHRTVTALLLTCGLAAGLTACGFHLRGTEMAALPQQYQSIQLDIPEQAQALKTPLTMYLANLGAKVDIPPSQTQLHITEYELKRLPFSGRLTEVQLRLTVTFYLSDMHGQALTVPRTVVAQRSYQYDRAGLNTDNQEEHFLIGVMQDDIALQIAREMHVNRIPVAQPSAQ